MRLSLLTLTALMVLGGLAGCTTASEKLEKESPVNGMDPIGSLDPATRDTVENTFAQVRQLIPPLG